MFSLDIGNVFWTPLIWIAAAAVTYLVIYYIRGFGKEDYKEKTGQTQAFLSGNPEYEKEQMHIQASNIYWGFLESLGWFYKILKKMHNGNVSDYILWFVIVMASLFILVVVI